MLALSSTAVPSASKAAGSRVRTSLRSYAVARGGSTTVGTGSGKVGGTSVGAVNVGAKAVIRRLRCNSRDWSAVSTGTLCNGTGLYDAGPGGRSGLRELTGAKARRAGDVI